MDITDNCYLIGFYIPARHHHDKAEIDALKQAALSLEKLLLSKGLNEEELFADFHVLREEKGR